MTTEITIPHETNDTPAYLTVPDNQEQVSSIILIHEVWGLNEHIKDVARRFMAEGYMVLAPDLISHTGITEKIDQGIMQEIHNPATRDEAQKKMREAMTPLQSPEFGVQTTERLQECFSFLQNHKNSNGKISVVGFCFGGTYAWNLAVDQPALAAAIPFYGHPPLEEDQLKKISCPVLAFFGEKDERLMAVLPQLETTMDKLEKNFGAVVYPNTGHAFFNDTNKSLYNETAALDAWAKVLAFLKNVAA